MGFEFHRIEANGELETIAKKNKYLFGIFKNNQFSKPVFKYLQLTDQTPPVAIFPPVIAGKIAFNKKNFNIDINFQPVRLRDALEDYLDFIVSQPRFACQKLLIPVIGHYDAEIELGNQLNESDSKTTSTKSKVKTERKTYVGLLEICIANKTVHLNFYDPGNYDTNREITTSNKLYEDIAPALVRNDLSEAKYQLADPPEGNSGRLIKSYHFGHYSDFVKNNYDFVLIYLKHIVERGAFNEQQVNEKIKTYIRHKQRASFPVRIPESRSHERSSSASTFIYHQDSVERDDHFSTPSDAISAESPHLETPFDRSSRISIAKIVSEMASETPRHPFEIRQVDTIIIEPAKKAGISQKSTSISLPQPVEAYLPLKPVYAEMPKPTETSSSWPTLSSLGHFINDHRQAFALAAAWIAITGLLIVGLILPPAFLVNLVGVGVLGAHGSIIAAMGFGSLNVLEGILTLAGLDLFLLAIGTIMAVAIATYSPESLAATDSSTTGRMTTTPTLTGKTARPDAQDLRPPGSSTTAQPPLPGREYFNDARESQKNPTPAKITGAAPVMVSPTLTTK